MRFYRVSYSTGCGNSGGFSWHASQLEALKAARAEYDENPAEYDHHAARARLLERVETIQIEMTRAGVLAALRQYAAARRASLRNFTNVDSLDELILHRII